MFKSLFVTYSQGGTTARVAAKIAAGLQTADWRVDICNLRENEPPSVEGYDLLGIGAPTYYYRPPFRVMDYVNSLPALNGLPSIVFILHGTLPGDAGNFIRRGLKRKGAQDAGYFKCFGADYFLGYLKQGYLFSADHPTSAELAAAERFGSDVAQRIARKDFSSAPEDPPPPPIYRLERFLSHRWLAEHVYSRMFQVDADLCTGCGLCIENCPVDNLTEGEKGRPKWGRDCLMCLYCEMECPEDAITSPVSLPLFLPFMVYNVKHAASNAAIDHVMVKHSQGRTLRI